LERKDGMEAKQGTKIGKSAVKFQGIESGNVSESSLADSNSSIL
jgi:hypothetical protein